MSENAENAPIPVRAYSYWSRVGRNSFMADCPYCGTSGRYYVWSVSGGGARCKNNKCDGIFGGLMRWEDKPRPLRRKAKKP